MANLFSNINLDVPASVDSTIDLKFLDTECNHQILNELMPFASGNIFTNIVYSGGNPYGSPGLSYSGEIDLDAFVYVTTTNPYINNLSVEFFEQPQSSSSQPLVEQFVVPSSLSTLSQLSFPPIPNTTVAQQVSTFIDADGETEIVYYPFTNYVFYQLFGNIQFTEEADIGYLTQFSYVGDKRKIIQKTKALETNWEFVGYNSNGSGIFKVYGRSFLTNKSNLIIRYTTDRIHCPRCAGNGIINDLDISKNTNKMYAVYDFSKLIQDFFKRFNTRKGSDIYDVTQGTQIPIFVGVGKSNPIFIDTMIRTEVILLVNQLRSKQASQSVFQGVGLAEQIQQINFINVQLTSPTDVDVSIEVQSRSGATSQIKSQVRGN